MRAVLTPDDLKKGDTVSEAGWFPLEITDYKEEDASTDGSTNCIWNFRVLDGKNKGLGAMMRLNEKALGFGKAFFSVVIGPPNKNLGYTADQMNSENFKTFIGKKLMGYIKVGESNKGNKYNELKDFKPLSA